MRQIILDTETTGLETSQGHRVIEVGAVEMVNRRLTGNNFHLYLNPEREIDEARPRNLGRLAKVIDLQSVDDLLSNLARRFPHLLPQ